MLWKIGVVSVLLLGVVAISMPRADQKQKFQIQIVNPNTQEVFCLSTSWGKIEKSNMVGLWPCDFIDPENPGPKNMPKGANQVWEFVEK
jgi:hypothetical protein